MRCQYCGGNGKVGFRRAAPEGATPIRAYDVVPCPECEGTGIGSCCEGDLPVGPVTVEAANG